MRMDRISVCEGFYMYHVLWHANGQTNRCVTVGRNIMAQLDRMRFRPSPLLSYESMSEEAWEVYSGLVRRWHGLDAAEDERNVR